MFMAFRIFIALLLLTSCAQVTSLTGGERDRIAPSPIENKVNPQNGSTNFIASKITIPFNEYIKLNNPLETIVMIPPHAKPKATLNKKTVTLTWEDTLENNTTYSIYLNETVQDITESNDSLMVFVFSTGDYIDSLSYQVKVVDAFTSQPIDGCFVGLYEGEMDSIRPTYFVKTNKQGEAMFSYLKAGDYNILAFLDLNKDMLLQANEKVAFKKEKVNLSLDKLDSNNVFMDSIPMRLFQRKAKPNIRTFNYTAPSLFTIGSTVSLRNRNFFIDGNEVTENIHFYSEDSLAIIYPVSDSSKMELVVQSEDFTDTTTIRLTKSEKSRNLNVWTNLKENVLNLSDTLTFLCSDNTKAIDTALISFINMDDSTEIDYTTIIQSNYVQFILDRDSLTSFQIRLKPLAILTENSSLSSEITKTITVKKEKDYGVLKLDISDYEEPIILEMLFNNAVFKRFHLKEEKSLTINELNPGNYTFRIILDENENGKWDTGDFENQIFPEVIHTFSEITNIRANWDVDVELTRKY